MLEACGYDDPFLMMIFSAFRWSTGAGQPRQIRRNYRGFFPTVQSQRVAVPEALGMAFVTVAVPAPEM
jgi:hypothetical protein